VTVLQRHLKSIKACPEAREWAGERTPEQAWDESPRADWLLWWAAKCGVDRKLLVKAACQCARRALRFVPDGEMRPLRAIEAAENWAENPTEQNVEAEAAAWAAEAAEHIELCKLVREIIPFEFIEKKIATGVSA